MAKSKTKKSAKAKKVSPKKAKPAVKKAKAKVTKAKATKPKATKPKAVKPKAKQVKSSPAKSVKPKAVKVTASKSGAKSSGGAVSNKTIRYSDKDLLEFKTLINKKVSDARVELKNLTAVLNHSGDHGTDDTASTFKVLEDGSDSMAKEEAAQLAARQKKFIEQLDAALMRIENKTYGVCRVTGKLIPKPRLRAVPHTTQSMEAKLKQYN